MECEVCKSEMLSADGCLKGQIKIKGAKAIKRSLAHWCEPGERCGDCGAKYGKPHHWGCDIERCPHCGGQLIGCECEGLTLLLQKTAH